MPKKTLKHDSPKKAPSLPERKIVYEDLDVVICTVDEGGVIDEEKAKDLLEWENEEEYEARVTKENEGKAKKDQKSVKMGDKFHFKDVEGHKIICHNNIGNRPFDELTAHKYAQDILTRNWADSRNSKKGEERTVNGETIIIGRSGLILSGQHRLIGLVFACQLWRKQKARWEKYWDEEPSMEGIVVQGVDESQATIMTLDNVKPRTLSDIIYTSECFSDLDIDHRRECSRMLDSATDLLWKRTAAQQDGSYKILQTHSTSMGFIDRHKRMLECIRHVFKSNSGGNGKVLSNFKLSPGECSTLTYLMGSSASDGEEYRLMEVPSEKKLDWSEWDAAVKFLELLSSGSEVHHYTRAALNQIQDLDEEERSKAEEDDESKYAGIAQSNNILRRAILVKAWEAWSEKGDIEEEDVKVEFIRGKDDKLHLPEVYTVGGIDLGDYKPYKEKEEKPTKEEIEAKKEEERLKKVEADKLKIEQAKERNKQKGKGKTPEASKNGKDSSPPPKEKKQTRKQIQEENTKKAKEADEELAKEKSKPKKKEEKKPTTTKKIERK